LKLECEIVLNLKGVGTRLICVVTHIPTQSPHECEVQMKIEKIVYHTSRGNFSEEAFDANNLPEEILSVTVTELMSKLEFEKTYREIKKCQQD
jgi:deoxycytidylate deaminase